MNTTSSPETATKNIPYLDGWRGLAIIMVLIGHFAHPPRFEAAQLGVDIFFVLSGYLMSRLLFIKRTPLPLFYKRRLSRIFPAFLFFVFAMALYTPVHVSVTEMAAILTFLRTYFPADVSIWSDIWPIGHLWSLNVEEHSYLWLSLGVVVSQGASKAGRVLLFFASTLALIFFYNITYHFHGPSGASPYYVRTECAALGLIASGGYRFLKDRLFIGRFNGAPAWLPLLTFVLAFCCYTQYISQAFSRFAAPLLLAVTVNHLDITYEKVLSALSLPWLRWFGVCSFSIYLWQQPFYLAKFPPLVGAVPAVLAGALSFYLIENPSRTYLNRTWAK